MLRLKNSWGKTCIFDLRVNDRTAIKAFTGSSLEREKAEPKNPIERILESPFKDDEETKEIKKGKKCLSQRTKAKMRKKLYAFSRVEPKLTFVTLTFLNMVEDKLAVKVLRRFLDNVGKRLTGFEYLWVAERQKNNKVFPDNIHFHLATNKYFKWERWWQYWISLQNKSGIFTRHETIQAPAAAFNVKAIKNNDVKGIGIYLTKYVTKNEDQFECQIWNCSKKVSALYTDFYSDYHFIEAIERLQKNGLLDGEIMTIPHDYHTLKLFPVNRNTLKLYTALEEKNKQIWKTLK